MAVCYVIKQEEFGLKMGREGCEQRKIVRLPVD